MTRTGFLLSTVCQKKKKKRRAFAFLNFFPRNTTVRPSIFQSTCNFSNVLIGLICYKVANANVVTRQIRIRIHIRWLFTFRYLYSHYALINRIYVIIVVIIRYLYIK
jgi:hypothetical protein